MPGGPIGLLGAGGLDRLQGKGRSEFPTPQLRGGDLKRYPHPSRPKALSSGRALSWGRSGGMGALGPWGVRSFASHRDPALRAGREARGAGGAPRSSRVSPRDGAPRQPPPRLPPAGPLAGTLTRRPSPLPGPPRRLAPPGPAASPPPASPAGGPLGPAAPPGTPGERQGLAEGRSGSCWDL